MPDKEVITKQKGAPYILSVGSLHTEPEPSKPPPPVTPMPMTEPLSHPSEALNDTTLRVSTEG